MTYTTVRKSYQAPTLAEAAEMMLRDSAVFDPRHGFTNIGDTQHRWDRGDQKGYSVESWEWHENTGELTVNFR